MWKSWMSLIVLSSFVALAAACGGKAETDCKTAPDYATCVAPIMEKSCSGTGCHGADKPAAGLALVGNKAADLVGAAGKAGGGKFKIVVASKPEESLLYLKLLAEADRPAAGKGVGGVMPIGPKKDAFTAENIATIKLWIEKGGK